MKVLIAPILLLANAGLFAAQLPPTPAQFAALRREAVRTIEGGKVLLPQDPKDPFTARFLPRLSEIKSKAQRASNAKKLEKVKASYEDWKSDIFKELYPQAAAQYANDPAMIHDAMQTRMNALLAAEHLNGVLSAEGDRAALDSLKQRIFTSADPQTLSRIYENIRIFTPSVVVPAAPADTTRRYSGVSEVSIRPAGVAPAVDAAPIPSNYQPVVDYLVKQGASRRVVALAIEEAKKQGVDPLMVLSVIQAESFFNPKATSECGAIGLMQIMPDTGRGLGVSNSSSLYDVTTNLKAGVRFLKGLWNQFSDVAFSQLHSVDPWARGDVKKAIAAYNAGPGAVQKYGGVPPYRETRNYVVKVLRYYVAMKRQLDS